jgi:hypothetical protein
MKIDRVNRSTCTSATSSITNPTWFDLGSNTGRCGRKPVTSRPGYGTANSLTPKLASVSYKSLTLFFNAWQMTLIFRLPYRTDLVKSRSKLLYDWRFTANYLILASSHLILTTKVSFFNWTLAVNCPYVTNLPDENIGLSLMNMLGLSSSVHFARIARYWRFFLLHYTEVLCQHKLCKAGHVYPIIWRCIVSGTCSLINRLAFVAVL